MNEIQRLFLATEVFSGKRTTDFSLCLDVKIPHSLQYVLFPRHSLSSSTSSSFQFPFIYHFLNTVVNHYRLHKYPINFNCIFLTISEIVSSAFIILVISVFPFFLIFPSLRNSSRNTFQLHLTYLNGLFFL